MNEIRYDCAIYLRNSQTLILIKISVYISKKQLEKYNHVNFKKDIYEMQRFLKENNLEVKHYYLLFILEKNAFTNKRIYNLFNFSNFSYVIYDYDENCFEKEINEFYEINYSPNENINNLEEEGEIFEFEYIDNNFNFNKENKETIYYAYKGMKLKDFLEQIIFEGLIDRLDELLNSDQEKYTLDKVSTVNGDIYRK